MREYRLICVALLCGFLTAYGAPVTLEWDNPTTNTDGSELTDLAGIRIGYATLVVTYTETNKVFSNVVVTNKAPVWVWVGLTNSVTLDLPGQFYAFWAKAVVTSGMESDQSTGIVKRVGSPTTIKTLRVK